MATNGDGHDGAAWALLVNRQALTRTRSMSTERRPLAEGEVRLAIESFALTANNVTYAVVGATMKYWDFFSSAGEWGCVPVWGHARVAESRQDDIAVDERLYGYLPMASELVVTPGKISPGQFTDMAPRRQPMATVYNQYRRLANDPAHDPAMEDARMLFEPLFLTSFLIDDAMRRAHWHGASQAILTSASSKTALGLAHVMAAASPAITRIGLTSARNRAFVEATGAYDKVWGYDEVGSARADGQAVLVDFAGDMALVAAVERARSPALVHVLRVGATHHEESAVATPLEALKPGWFFAPDAAAALIAEIGPAGFQAAAATRWRGFAKAATGWTTVQSVSRVADIAEAWVSQVEGRVDPATGIIARVGK